MGGQVQGDWGPNESNVRGSGEQGPNGGGGAEREAAGPVRGGGGRGGGRGLKSGIWVAEKEVAVHRTGEAEEGPGVRSHGRWEGAVAQHYTRGFPRGFSVHA